MVLATMGEKVGEVRIDHYKQNNSYPLAAHTTNITQLVLNQSGTRLATASERGTVVRVFDTSTKNLIAEFRRGRKQL